MRRISRFRVRIECTPRGAYAPRSCVAVRTPAGEKRFLRCTYAHPIRSAVRQPAVDVGNTLAQIQARLFTEPPTVYVRVAVAFAVIVTTGGSRPPLLCCGADTCRRKSDFCDAHTHIRSRAAGVSPPWFGNGTGKGDAANVRGMALCANVEHTQRTVGGHCDPRDVRGTALCANVEQGGLWKRPCVFRIMDETRCRGTIAMDGTRCEQPPLSDGQTDGG
jgi:hypothetical protein